MEALRKEVQYRGLYIALKCDYYLAGSRKAGSQKKEKGHMTQHKDKFNTYKNCIKKRMLCLIP